MTERAELYGLHGRSLLDYASLLWEGRAVAHYDEPIFQHLLSLERHRSRLTSRGSLVVLVSVMPPDRGAIDVGGASYIPPLLARAIFVSLSHCLRDMDFSGWYRQDRIVGAVLPQGSEQMCDVRRRVHERVCDALRAGLPEGLRLPWHVRVVPLQCAATDRPR